jgi:alpha-mannosidase
MSGRFRAIFAAVGMLPLLLTGPVPGQTPTASRLAAAPPAAVSQPPSVPSAAPQVERVIVTFKTHFDIGYTDLAANVVQRYRTEMIDQALAVVDRSASLPPDRRFVWMTPGWPMAKILDDWEGQTVDRKDRVWRAFRDGRFATHALPFTTHTELLDIEDLVRGMGFSSSLSRVGGLPLPRDAKMTDVPCHSWIMPTLLRRAGVEFLHLGCNAGSSSPELPRLFWWEGPDGSRLLTMYIAEGYGTGLMPPDDWPYKTWLALIHTGDNAGPPKPEQVEQLLQEAEKRLPGVQVRIGRLSDFADAIRAEQADLPVVRGDMPDTWIHGPMCDPDGARIARNLRPAIAACESLDTHLRGWGVDLPEPRQTIAAAYEHSLLYGEHTWGGALYWITSYAKQRNYAYGDDWKKELAAGKFARLDASWDEHTAYIKTAESLIAPLQHSQLQALAAGVSVTGPRIVVSNPLPWRRDGVVRVSVGETAVEALQPAEGGETVAVERDGESVRFVARDVPAGGYRTYVPAAVAAVSSELHSDEREGVLESPFYRAVIDRQRGVIRSLIDKRTGREWADGAAPQGLGQYLYERFDADQVKAYVTAYVKIPAEWAVNEIGKPAMPPAAEVPYRAASPERFTADFTHSPVSVSAVLRSPAGGGVPHPVTTVFTLYRDLPCVDIELTLHDKPADPWPEAGWICLPLNVPQPQFRVGRQGSTVDPARDIVPGANRHILAVNSGLTVADAEGRGVGICPLDSPLVSLDSPGCWKYSKDFVPRQSRVYVNLFNNQWTTNFRLWNGGTWTSRVRLWAAESDDAAKTLVVPAAEARAPLAAGFAAGPGGQLAAVQRGLAVSSPGTLVTAFGPNPDGAGTIVRLWECAGRGGDCEIRLPDGCPAATAQSVDLRGQPQGAPMAIQDSQFRAAVEPFAPATFLLPAP